MSFWDDLSSAASQAVTDNSGEIFKTAAEYFKQQIIPQDKVPQQVLTSSPATPPPAQVIMAQAATAAKSPILYIALAAIAVLGIFLFTSKRGK